ncbi:MAG: hypothetical protein K0S32_2721 [Bacteroidetes bacterium]|jgi:hypothetical protein|nr:hypothetical protein [Bacteroidota bacterium]
MEEHKHNHKDFEDLLRNMKTGKTDNLDDFEREALEGFDTLDSQEEALNTKAELDKRIHAELFTEEKRRRPVAYWFAAAGLFLVIGLSVLFVMNNKDLKGDAVADTGNKETKSLEEKVALSAPVEETTVTSTDERKTNQTEIKPETGKTKNISDTKDQSGDLKRDEDKKEDASNSRMITGKGPTQSPEFKANPNAPKEDITFSSSRNDAKTTPVVVNGELAKQASERANDESNVKDAMLDGLADNREKKEEAEKAPMKERAVLKMQEKVSQKDKESERDDYKKEAKAKEKQSRKKSAEETKSMPASSVPSGYAENESDKGKYDKDANSTIATGSATKLENTVTITESDGKNKVVNGQAETVAVNGGVVYWNANENQCYYVGGKDQMSKDISEKLMAKKIIKKFDVILSINEKKKVEKVFYLNVYDLTKDEQSKVTDVLKSLNKFDYHIQPNTKGLSEYKLEYRP